MLSQRSTSHNEVKIEGRVSKKFSILYVDDEPHNLRVFKSSFRRYYNVFTAESPFQAMEVLKEKKIHLVVTDQKMPGMNGTEFLETILPEYPNIISMIITGFSDIDDIAKAINECGIYRYITKPWDMGELKLTLDKAIEVYTLKSEKEELINELFVANTSLEEKVEERTAELSNVNSRLFESINYALNIQKSILPSKSILDHKFSDSMIYYSPQDIVSGDFYYFKEIDDKVIVAAFDCTGHGVPGALLSILGYTALESIIEDLGIVDGSKIMSMLNYKVYSHLSESNDMDEGDGMDGSLLIIDNTSKKAHMYSANSEIIYFEREDLMVLKGQKFSIGSQFYLPEKVYGFDLPLDVLSEIYLFSDGYKDQLNEENTRRFSMGRFKNLIKDIHHLSMNKQTEKLEEERVEWRGSEKSQTDDIMVVGIRI